MNVICPKCNKEIESLNHFQSGEMKFECIRDEKHGMQYEEKEFQPDDKVNEWECPECSEVLFQHEDDAKKFLNGV